MMTLRMALRSIGANKMRAMLTMLGIIIGVVALVVLVSLVNGATSSVTDAVSSLGSDMLTVTVSDDKGRPVNMETLSDWTRSEPAVGLSSPSITASLTGKYGSESNSFTVYGVNAFYDRKLHYDETTGKVYHALFKMYMLKQTENGFFASKTQIQTTLSQNRHA